MTVTTSVRTDAAVRTSDRKPWVWAAAAVVAACIPFLAGASTSHVFFVRDLTMFFWPRHLWIHDLMTHGRFPLWDPHSAAGQPIYPDALNQLFLPPVALLRYLPPVIGFNLIVALPFPVAALGMWLFARRECSALASTVGAIVFAVSGPVVSTGNFPNLSWSIAWVPWILWAYTRDRDAPSPRRLVVLAGMIALQILSGEPVTMAGTLVVLAGYALFGAATSLRLTVRRLSRIAIALCGALAASAMQLVPMLLAARTSARGLMRIDNFWSLHPLWLAESMLPHVFGNTFTTYDRALPWIRPLNGDRDPFFYSLYLGAAAAALAVVGWSSSSRRRRFWGAVIVVSVCLAFGAYTPIYPWLQRLLPPLRTFRFPVKFLLFVSLAVAILAAYGADALVDREAMRDARAAAPLRGTIVFNGAVVIALLALGVASLLAPFAAAHAIFRLGTAVGIADPIAGTQYVFEHLRPIAFRSALLWAAATGLIYLAAKARNEQRIARGVLAAVIAADLAAANVGVNPVIDAARIGRPAWAAAVSQDPHARYYFGGKFRGSLAAKDVDLRGIAVRPPSDATVEEGRAIVMAQVGMTPSPWGIRELLSYDLPQLWPVEHLQAQSVFEAADPAARLRFLERGGVRYCIAGHPPTPGAVATAAASQELSGLVVYDCLPHAARLQIVEHTKVVENHNAQLAALFAESPELSSTVLLDAPPPDASGAPGPAASVPQAQIDGDGDTEVDAVVDAGARGGFVVLLDSYDSAWTATVDGTSAPLLHANALFRAVRVSPGRHRVHFAYRPRLFYLLVGLSAAAWLTGAVVLAAEGRPF